MSTIPFEIAITGIAGNDYAGAAYSPLYVPIEQETDLRIGHVEPTSDKLGNDPNVDVTVFLSTWDIASDLSQGAWKKDKALNAPTYDEPMYTLATSTSLVQPLAWTLNRDVPLMCGCGLKEQNGSYAFAQFERLDDGTNNRLYGMDVKSNKVYYDNAGTWTDTTATGSGNVTDLVLYGKNDTNKRLYLGRSTGNARYYTGAAWVDAGYAAQHFVQVNKNWFYSNANELKKDGGGFDVYIGSGSKSISSLLWFNTQILVGKPEGLSVVDPTSKVAQQIIKFPDQDANNCRFLVLHNGSAWFPAGDILYELTAGYDIIRHRIATFESTGVNAYSSGKCLWAYSDGNNLYITYKVTTLTTYDYFLVVWTGANGGFHPVHVVSVLKANDPSYTTGGIYFDNNQLRYSYGNDKTGYLLTDGNQPLNNTGGSIYYTANVGIWLGWFTANRDAVTKFVKSVRASIKDNGSTGQLRVMYRKWTDSAATNFPSDITGTQENTEMTPTAEGSNVAGFTTTKVNIGLQLRNSSGSPANPWYLKTAHLVGAVTYGRAILATFNALVTSDTNVENRASGRSYDGRRIYEGLLAGVTQSAPVQVTLNGTTYTGRLLPNAGGEVLIDVTKDTQKARRRKLAITFREYA